MGWFNRLHLWHPIASRHPHPKMTRKGKGATRPRICRFEEIEPRQLLSASPIQVGSVYFEPASRNDEAPNQIEITFAGGAPGTQLTDLVIDTDKVGDGLTIGDCLFDTAPGGLGAYGSQPFKIVSQSGIDSVQATVVDGGSKLTFHFSGFDAGEKLVFSIDVDEMGFLGANAVAEGNEWEGTKMSATFAAPHYYNASGSDIYLDFYDTKLAASGLALPPDSYVPPGMQDASDYTAGAIFPLTQTPLPITLSGTVFEDMNGNNAQDSVDAGISGVQLTLYSLQDSQYVSTGLTTVTDPNGHYQFDSLLPGTYRVGETQPSGYLSIGARAGTVDGQTRGVVTDSDTLSNIALEGGDKSLRNDFAEARPASLSGYVYADDNLNGVKDAGEMPIANAHLTLLDANGQATGVTTTTDAQGYYVFGGLKPGAYGVAETQPDGYADGLDAAGTAGGVAHNPGDSITGATLTSNMQALHYDFGEVRYADVSGFVYADANDNGVFNGGEKPIAGVAVYLVDSSGAPIADATTGLDGSYHFAQLLPGVYGVKETQPQAYLDGKDTPGSVGGVVDGNDLIDQIKLVPASHAVNYNFGELLPSEICGNVYVDLNDNGVIDAGEKPIGGVTVYLLDSSGSRIATTTTAQDGTYCFDQLRPGTYGVEEVQPQAYLDGKDTAGTAGGVTDVNDHITQIKLVAGTNAEDNNFGEIPPSSLSGYVLPRSEQQRFVRRRGKRRLRA